MRAGTDDPAIQITADGPLTREQQLLSPCLHHGQMCNAELPIEGSVMRKQKQKAIVNKNSLPASIAGQKSPSNAALVGSPDIATLKRIGDKTQPWDTPLETRLFFFA